MSLSFVTPVHVEETALDGLKGAPFTDPSKIQPMPVDWEKQPIKYGPSDIHADIVMSLDQHLYPALLPVIQDYAKKNNLKIVVNEGTCGISSGMLVQKSIDIGGFCCAPGRTDRLPGLKFHTVGIGAIALLVHPDNPVANITIGEARRIFMGEISRWSDLDGDREVKKRMNIPVQPVGRLHCKLRPGHWRLLLDNEDLFSPGLQEVGAIPDMISQVALNTGAIGYEVLWNTIRYKEKGRVKVINIDGYSPANSKYLISGEYPLYRVYNLTTWEGEGLVNPHAKKLVKFLLLQAEHLAKEHYIVPASQLRKAGWRFIGDELIGEPE